MGGGTGGFLAAASGFCGGGVVDVSFHENGSASGRVLLWTALTNVVRHFLQLVSYSAWALGKELTWNPRLITVKENLI